ncbi:MAG: hypothetical protein JXR83_06815 [Deltaproteobacteria bacterium]|nr:hypothetical protein [Deltaproteobacteria bacterium]
MTRDFAVVQHRDRRLDAAFCGDILIWDIDKTYLNTHFSTWRGLLAIPFEFAVDKEALPGTVALLHGLRHGPDLETRQTPLYFVSASPPQLRAVLTRKMVLDGVEYDGLTFKDQLGLLGRGRWRELRHQLGYKLAALLQLRAELPAGCRLLLFGDNAEDDADIFALFAATCAGVRGRALESRLRDRGATAQAAQALTELASRLPVADCVERCYLHLVRPAPLAAYDQHHPLLVATRDALEQALHLAQSGRLRQRDVEEVGREMIARGIDRALLRQRVDETAARFALPPRLVGAVLRALHD